MAAKRIGPELAWLTVDDPESFVSVRCYLLYVCEEVVIRLA